MSQDRFENVLEYLAAAFGQPGTIFLSKSLRWAAGLGRSMRFPKASAGGVNSLLGFSPGNSANKQYIYIYRCMYINRYIYIH